MIRAISQKYCEAVEFILGTSLVAFLYPSLSFHVTGALWVSHLSLSPHSIKIYSEENYPSWKCKFCQYILQGLAPNFLSQILNCHSCNSGQPHLSILDMLSHTVRIGLPTHYTLTIYSLSTYLQDRNTLISLRVLENDQLSLNLRSPEITCSRKTLLVTQQFYKLNDIYWSTL